MATAERQLTLTVNNPFPGDGGVIATESGNWVDLAANFSIAVVAWFGRNESRADNGGVIRTLPANWLDIDRLQAGNNLIIPFTAPVNYRSQQRYPDHYAAYYRIGATWDLSTPGIRIGGADRFDTSLTSDKPFQTIGTTTGPPSSTDCIDSGAAFTTVDSNGYQEAIAGDIVQNITDGSSCTVLAVNATTLSCTALTGGTDDTFETGDAYEVQRTVTLGSSPTTFNIKHVMRFKEIEKVLVAGSWDGTIIKLSYWNQDNPVDGLDMEVIATSFSSRSLVNAIKNWRNNGIAIQIDHHDYP